MGKIGKDGTIHRGRGGEIGKDGTIHRGREGENGGDGEEENGGWCGCIVVIAIIAGIIWLVYNC